MVPPAFDISMCALKRRRSSSTIFIANALRIIEMRERERSTAWFILE
jgi:hypothetical protein